MELTWVRVLEVHDSSKVIKRDFELLRHVPVRRCEILCHVRSCRLRTFSRTYRRQRSWYMALPPAGRSVLAVGRTRMARRGEMPCTFDCTCNSHGRSPRRGEGIELEAEGAESGYSSAALVVRAG